MTKPLRALGLMSGTSMDGIDAALLTTDGKEILERGPSATFAYPAQLRSRLGGALADAAAMTERNQRPGCLGAVERELTERHAAVAAGFLRDAGIGPDSIDVIGFHGQTVVHRPEARLTVQLGDGPLLAKLTGTDVVHDLRAADIASGGQGAPLVPVYHGALAALLPQRPVAFLNIGGVANVTWVGTQGELMAFDTGPGNALIDDWVSSRTGRPQDTGGALAATGKVNVAVLAQLLSQSYFNSAPPKSLDRNGLDGSAVNALSLADGAATLVAFTASAVRKAVDLFPHRPRRWIVSGGGRKNASIMAALAGELDAPVTPAEAIGLDGDGLEAEAWAYLAVRSLRQLPISFPLTTGAPHPMTGGMLAKARP